jgi:hypothetical protein
MRYPRDFAPSLSLASDAVKGFPDEMCPTERSRVRATACVFVRLCGHMRVRACGASQFEASPSHPHGRRMVHAVRWVLIGTHCPVRTRLLFLYKAGDIISQVRSCSTHSTHYRTSHRTESHGGPHLPYTRLPHARPGLSAQVQSATAASATIGSAAHASIRFALQSGIGVRSHVSRHLT